MSNELDYAKQIAFELMNGQRKIDDLSEFDDDTVVDIRAALDEMRYDAEAVAERAKLLASDLSPRVAAYFLENGIETDERGAVSIGVRRETVLEVKDGKTPDDVLNAMVRQGIRDAKNVTFVASKTDEIAALLDEAGRTDAYNVTPNMSVLVKYVRKVLDKGAKLPPALAEVVDGSIFATVQSRKVKTATGR